MGVKESKLAGITFTAKENVVTQKVSDYAAANNLYFVFSCVGNWMEGQAKCELMADMIQKGADCYSTRWSTWSTLRQNCNIDTESPTSRAASTRLLMALSALCVMLCSA